MLTVRKMAARAIYNKSDIQDKTKEATIYLYGDIGGWFGIDHLEWVKDFNSLKADTIHLRVDSSGGDVFAARAMKTAVMQHKAHVIAHIDGIAASAASFFVTGADEIEIVEGGFLMIHNALSFLDIFGYFNMEDLDKLFSDLEKEKNIQSKINESIINDYAKRTGKDEKEIVDWMNGETWFTAKEALENNFVDRIYDGEPVEGSYDLSVFAHVPESLRKKNQKLSKRTLEKILRDAGVPNKEAKKILSEGFIDDLRDEGLTDKLSDKATNQPDDQRDADVIDQRDVDVVEPKKKDRMADLLTRAEVVAPS